MIISTADSIEDKKIKKTYGMVNGHCVKARGTLRDAQAGLRNVLGGRVGVYEELLTDSRQLAIDIMITEAENLGANAIVAFRMSTNSVMQGATEIFVYGTAVSVE